MLCDTRLKGRQKMKFKIKDDYLYVRVLSEAVKRLPIWDRKKIEVGFLIFKISAEQSSIKLQI